jgi:hypothetical protein
MITRRQWLKYAAAGLAAGASFFGGQRASRSPQWQGTGNQAAGSVFQQIASRNHPS